jgi:hypothetical protein
MGDQTYNRVYGTDATGTTALGLAAALAGGGGRDDTADSLQPIVAAAVAVADAAPEAAPIAEQAGDAAAAAGPIPDWTAPAFVPPFVAVAALQLVSKLGHRHCSNFFASPLCVRLAQSFFSRASAFFSSLPRPLFYFVKTGPPSAAPQPRSHRQLSGHAFYPPSERGHCYHRRRRPAY